MNNNIEIPIGEYIDLIQDSLKVTIVATETYF